MYAAWLLDEGYEVDARQAAGLNILELLSRRAALDERLARVHELLPEQRLIADQHDP